MQTKIVPVSELSLDLNNFRSTPQPDELSAARAMIATGPAKFWGLFDSLMEDGYLPNESIVVLRSGNKNIVMEGNRRVALLKIFSKQLDAEQLDINAEARKKIDDLSNDWLVHNSSVPCTVYDSGDAERVDRVISRIHGKNDKAGRDHWESIARARHNRDKNGNSEPNLDLFEKFLEITPALSPDQKLRWQGQYPISVLEEATKRLAPRLGCANAVELATTYPKIIHRNSLDEIILAIGRRSVKFPIIRGNDDWYVKFGIPNAKGSSSATTSAQEEPSTDSGGDTQASPQDDSSYSNSTHSSAGGGQTHATGSDPSDKEENSTENAAASEGEGVPIEHSGADANKKDPPKNSDSAESKVETDQPKNPRKVNAGQWKIDARFPRSELVRRVELIGSLRDSITVDGMDAERYFSEKVDGLPTSALIYCDPPYFKKADRLYLNHYAPGDHERIAKVIRSHEARNWVVSYDGAPEILDYYEGARKFVYDLQYNAARAYKGKEVFIFAERLVIPRRSVLPFISEGLKNATLLLHESYA